MKPSLATQIIQAVSEYHAVFGDPLPYRAVTARWHHHVLLQSTLNDLQAKGIIRLYLNRQGGKALALTHLDYSASTTLPKYRLIPFEG